MTMPTLAAVLAAVQDVVGVVAGITLAPDIPPEQIPSGGVYGIVFPAAGTYTEISAGRQMGEHTIHLLLVTPRKNLRTDWARIITIGDTVQRALLAGGTLSATLLQSNEIRYTFGEIEWGGQQLFGWRFEIDVQTHGSLA